ncbi:MAG: DUF4595 domain-containing protein, partial [Bacteroidaceae bacterium]|nr:DUF4595 domain-containing protein [Bacteroidaceae bacterium]
NFAFNEKGYISKFNYNEIDEYEDKNGEYGKEVDKAKGNYKLSYDNDGYLVKITGSTSWEDTYQGETERYQDEETITQTWNNGLLMEYKYESVLSNGDYRIYILSYDYGNKIYQNKYKQYFDIDGGVLDILFGWIGLLGKGPDYLPESMTITEIEKYEGEEYESEDTYSFSYEFNEDGTIHYIDSNYYTEFYYTYGTYEDQLNMDENETKSTRSGKRVNRNFLFGKYFMR